ncbi:hypothetical protein MA16_Dca021894 [Dendrobium catenatum]|uniref:Uncharacterized protein n=1 Tax=Dendrobium catenatum TaxID=906689 RepID=A0A2I0WHL3_9ASPA|nr:hypothetical protein MA16_Dca021894 [Dendrobium catenatum]
MGESSADHTSSEKERSIQRGHCGDLRASTTPTTSDRGQISGAAKEPRQSVKARNEKGSRKTTRQRDTDIDGKKIAPRGDVMRNRTENSGTASLSVSFSIPPKINRFNARADEAPHDQTMLDRLTTRFTKVPSESMSQANIRFFLIIY